MMLSSEAQSAFFNKESVQKEIKATVSQKTTLSCEVADTNAEVKWYKDGKLLTSSRTIHAESNDKSRQLVIDSVEKKDAGEYICEAGSEKLAFNIHVAGNREGDCQTNSITIWVIRVSESVFFKSCLKTLFNCIAFYLM